MPTLTVRDVITSWGQLEVREKWSWSTFCKFIFNTSKGFSQGYCTGQLSRSNCPCDLHMTWLWPFTSGCPVSWNRASHECGDWLVSDRLHISTTKTVEEMELLPSFSRVVKLISACVSLLVYRLSSTGVRTRGAGGGQLPPPVIRLGGAEPPWFVDCCTSQGVGLTLWGEHAPRPP